MPRQTVEQVLRFPLRGVSVMFPRHAQPDGTCVNSLNVMPFDRLEGRARGGPRPGVDNWNVNTIDGANLIQDINYVTVVKDEDPATSGLDYRQQRAAIVSNGTIAWVQPGATAINTATVNGTSTLVGNAQFIFSTNLYGRLYYTDGYDYKIWVANNNVAIDWTPSAGSLPGDPGNTSGRLMVSWRSRIVIAGLRDDAHNWFMSAVGDPLDWDYAPTNTTETQAVQGAIGVAGPMDDVVTCLAPYNEDILIIGGDKSIWQMSGDPQAGGRFDMITNAVGMAFGRPFCQDPTGVMYFLSSRSQLYRMVPGQVKPEPISDESINPLIEDTNLNTTFVQMAWDDKNEGVWIFFSPFANSAATHYFWSQQTQGFYPMKFANTELNPLSIKVFDGDDADDRVILMGSHNGYVNYLNTSATEDIGVNFTSQVTIGPMMIGPANQNRFIIKELSALSDADGAGLKYEILIGDTPQEAAASEAATFNGADGTFAAGLSLTDNPNIGGYYAYLKVGNNINTSWAMEYVRVRVAYTESDTGRTQS